LSWPAAHRALIWIPRSLTIRRGMSQGGGGRLGWKVSPFGRPVRELGPPQREHIRPTAFALSLARLKEMGGGKRSRFEDRLWYFKRGLGRKTVPLFRRGVNFSAERTARQQATAAWLRCSFLHAQVGDGCHTFRASMADIDFETQVQKRRRRWTFSSSPPQRAFAFFHDSFQVGRCAPQQHMSSHFAATRREKEPVLCLLA